MRLFTHITHIVWNTRSNSEGDIVLLGKGQRVPVLASVLWAWADKSRAPRLEVGGAGRQIALWTSRPAHYWRVRSCAFVIVKVFDRSWVSVWMEAWCPICRPNVPQGTNIVVFPVGGEPVDGQPWLLGTVQRQGEPVGLGRRCGTWCDLCGHRWWPWEKFLARMAFTFN